MPEQTDAEWLRRYANTNTLRWEEKQRILAIADRLAGTPEEPCAIWPGSDCNLTASPRHTWCPRCIAKYPPAPTGTPEPVTMESQCDLAEWQRAIEAAREVLDAAVQRGMGESA